MSHHHIPLNELAVAVQSAVEQVLGKHGAVPIEKLWVGFVAPDALANEEAAGKLAARLGKEGGVHGQPSVAQQVVSVGASGPAAEEVTPQLQKQIRIIGLMYSPKAER
ncbi:MAG TPA: hypothetical protein VNZ03_04695 [Terriglobales bacterium]|jgi:hypothetical protein|nr:hypothetical protein [Terriglobales bacterium]